MRYVLRKKTNGELGEVFPAAFAVVIFMMALEFVSLPESSAQAHSGLIKNSCRFSRHNRVFEPRPVESSVYANRIDDLRQTPARVKFLSLEPLLDGIPSLNLQGIDWVIVGGESGPGARPMREEWGLDVRDQCVAAGVPFFFKQWGGINKKRAGRLLQGKTYDETPTGL